jgi:hypothetical protein
MLPAKFRALLRSLGSIARPDRLTLIKEWGSGMRTKLIPLAAVAGIAALLWAGSAVPAAASTAAGGAARPHTVRSNILSDCWVTGSGVAVSGGVVTYDPYVYCGTIVDFIQVWSTVTTYRNSSLQTIGSNYCQDDSTSGFDCEAAAYCQGTGYYGGTADVIETNSVGYSSEQPWNQTPIYLGC